MTVKIIGHRGDGRTEDNPFAAGRPPQHTRLSFEKVIADGADGVEFDIFLSKDDVPFIIHRQGAIDLGTANMTIREIQNIALPDNQTILTLEECLTFLAGLYARNADRDLMINAELKGPGVVDRTRDIVESVAVRTGLNPDKIIYDALEWDRLSHMRRVDPKANIMPALSTAHLFNTVGKGAVDPAKNYDPKAMQDLEAFIRDEKCCGIDVMTGDIRPDMMALAKRLDVGFCSYPQGPQPLSAAAGIQHNIGLLEEFSRHSSKPVILKVEDVVATRGIVADYNAGKPVSVDKVEMMMGLHLN